MMSLNGITKGTEFESMMKSLMQAEANGVMMYYALAQLAREQGLDDVAEGFVAAANEEAVHAGFYAVLNGKYPSDFWGLVRTVQKAEANGEAQVKAIADKSALPVLQKQPIRWTSSRVRKAATASACRPCSTSTSRRKRIRPARKSMSAPSAATNMSATSTTKTTPTSARSAVSRRAPSC